MREQLVKSFAVRVVEITRGLIRQDDEGVRSQGARHRRSLLLTTGKLRRPVRHSSRESNCREQLLRPGSSPPIGLACNQQRHHDVFQRGEFPKQMMELKYEAELSVADSRETF
jgi:hypothetical protein